jgi:hypothetical protein
LAAVGFPVSNDIAAALVTLKPGEFDCPLTVDNLSKRGKLRGVAVLATLDFHRTDRSSFIYVTRLAVNGGRTAI